MRQSTIDSLRQMVTDVRKEAEAAGVQLRSDLDMILPEQDAFDAVIDYVEAKQLQIAESKRLIGVLVASGIISIMLIALAVLPLQHIMNDFDFAVCVICLIDLVICVGGCWTEIRKISASGEEGETDA